MHQGDGARGCGRCAEQLELVVAGSHLQPRHHGDAVAGDTAKQVAKDGIELVVLLDGWRYAGQLDENLPGSILGQVQTPGGHPPGDGTADVEEVGVALGAGTQDRIGKEDGV